MSSAIGNSADAWAVLVANVAPLLVLVGEKHVKAYFKLMCRPSHHLLYASSPIGLVTAVTTLIRLSGSPLLKRIIGRQFETRAEVLADVTSVSGGEVVLELKNGILEQTTRADPQDMAVFYVHGSKNGLATDIVEVADDVFSVMMNAGPQSARGMSRKVDWAIHFTFRANGEGAVWTARKFAWQSIVSDFTGDTELGKFEEQEILESIGGVGSCDGLAVVYASWTGVSLSLTASYNLDNGTTDTLRLLVVAFCTFANAGIVAANWIAQRNVQNTVLVSAGLFVSICGSYFTAHLVNSTSFNQVVDLRSTSATRAGFFSTNETAKLSFCPPKVVMSSRVELEYSAQRLAQSLTPFFVAFIAMGFIALYLGLRTSRWWTALAMLGNSAVAAIARAYLIPEKLSLLPYDTMDNYSPRPMARPLGSSDGESDHLFPDEEVGQLGTLNAHGSTYEDNQLQSSAIRQNPVNPVRIGSKYAVIGSQLRYCDKRLCLDLDLDLGGSGSDRRFLAAALNLTLAMTRRGFVPLEVKQVNLGAVKVTYNGRFLFSDILSRSGIWRQPFEIFVNSDSNSRFRPAPLTEFYIYFKTWGWRAGVEKARRLTRQPLETRINIRRRLEFTDTQDESPTSELNNSPFINLRNGDSLWMAVKIISAITLGWEIDQLERFVVSVSGDQTDSILDQDERNLFLDCIQEAGLILPMDQP